VYYLGVSRQLAGRAIRYKSTPPAGGCGLFAAIPHAKPFVVEDFCLSLLRLTDLCFQFFQIYISIYVAKDKFIGK
jgi:hypothetical protein